MLSLVGEQRVRDCLNKRGADVSLIVVAACESVSDGGLCNVQVWVHWVMTTLGIFQVRVQSWGYSWCDRHCKCCGFKQSHPIPTV